ncbi:MAG: helix-turn-helix transcriptional regulator [Terrimicrobiaceae bacterium]|nr:helix-turn-helix transcriptional regulator [Terrimicrobiaceae bacterium]
MVTSIGKNIKRFRNQKELTQKQLAEKAGITLFTLTKIEGGKTPDPRILTMKKISEVLKKSIDDLIK